MIGRLSAANLVKSFGVASRLYKNTIVSSSCIGQSCNLSTNSAPSRVFAQYTLYKEKSALTVSPVSPTLVPVSDYAKKIKKEGSIIFEFTPANSSGKGMDWQKKQFYSLYPTELGSLITCDIKKGLEFSHEFIPNGKFKFFLSSSYPHTITFDP
jgi:hypothetical protein